MRPHDLSRRELLALATPGLFVFFPLEPLEAFQEPARLPGRQAGPTDFNAWLRIGENGRVTCFAGKVELGQGPTTALAQLLAEELDVAYDAVDMVLGDTDLCPYDMGTFGSMGIRLTGPLIRAAAAEARAVLVQMAAERLAAPAGRLQVKAGVVTDPSSAGKRVTYAELVQGKRIERHIEKVPLKPPAAFTVVGRPAVRKDARDKVTGKGKYAGDFAFPGMLHARILRPPAHGAALQEVDTTAAEKAGARVVRDGGLLAILHERRDLADRALGLVKARFTPPPPGPDDKTIFDHLLKTAPEPRLVGESGSLTEGAKLAHEVVEQTYLNSYVAHAPMETHSATAVIENGKATVWASTQAPFGVKQQVAQALGFTPPNVRIVAPYVGGGFGGKSGGQQAVEAARLAAATGQPVQVVWDRTEEFFFDTFRPAAVVKIRAGLTSAGRIAFWDYQVYGAGDREAHTFYDIPHRRTVSAGNWMGGNPPGMHPFGVGPWRAPSVNTNTFARESQMDILAAKAGVDPLEFRLAHLSDRRMRRVLEAAAKQFGWVPGKPAGKPPSGRGVGVACGIYSGTYVATMAEVVVPSTGRVQVKRVVTAQDQGLTVNPDGSRQQMEGSITMGLGQALGEEVRFRNGEVLDRNFDSYQVPRFSWVPRIETILIDNPDTPATGCGEPPIITVAAVIANAIYDAANIRLLQLPMTPARILEARKRG
ncbi:MAG: molybdopterin-dependent oxidoreductase [Acidobacteriia bacterium]|nr:molybdopterin-dependent oxidoreductase [Terriglobia bacterium]